MRPVSRRRVLLAVAAPTVTLPLVSGCGSDTVKETIAEADTQTLEQSKVALRGFAIVTYIVGARVVTLPTPGVRILGVALVITSIATKLAIEYLDVELKKRYVAEELSEEEARAIESDLHVVFQLENGDSEKVPLGENRYES